MTGAIGSFPNRARWVLGGAGTTPSGHPGPDAVHNVAVMAEQRVNHESPHVRDNHDQCPQ